MKKCSVLFLVITFFLGCANTPELSEDNSYSPEFNGVNKKQRVLIVPVRENLEGLEHGGEIVLKEIGKQLKLNGWRVNTLSKSDYIKIWSKINSLIGGIFSPSTGLIDTKKYEYALFKFVQLVNQTENYSAILFPSFFLKQAKLKGKHAYWDGVKRKKVVKGNYSHEISWSGTTRGLSLELIAFNASGKWLFTSYGGLLLPFYTKIKNNKPVATVRDNMFEELDNIESGVKVALFPILIKGLEK